MPAEDSASIYPWGWLGFSVTGLETGGNATVTIQLAADSRPLGYYKQDPVTGSISSFDFDGTTGATMDGNVITLHFVDGGRADADEQLHLLPRTLRQWDYDEQAMRGAATLGRPLLQTLPSQRAAIGDLLHNLGPAVGVPSLRREFPGVARAELAEILQDYRLEWRQEHDRDLHVLHWQAPGRVWAIDFAEPSLLKATISLPPIDGACPYLLAVRDLASGFQLAWLPVAEATAAPTQRVLAQLFAEHGVPLVLKSDNGSAFRADETKAFVERAGVFALFSPAACPSYNGSIEASIGSGKKRTEQQAVRQGHPGIWTSADLAAARQEANTGHPERLNGRTPAAVWARRSPIGFGERLRFAVAVESQREAARQELGIALDATLGHWEEGKVDRKALPRALVEHGYLLFTRRRIPLAIHGGKVPSDG